jgi:hypothetical protein
VRITQKVYPHAGGYCIFSTKRIHRAIGGFDESILLGEDADYVRRASKKARFAVLRACVHPSERRFDKEGRWSLVWKLLRSEMYRMLRGEIRTDKFSYDFTGYKD